MIHVRASGIHYKSASRFLSKDEEEESQESVQDNENGKKITSPCFLFTL